MFESIVPHFTSFALALVFTLVLTPLVREMNRRLGMVDMPDRRRVNKVPVPRGGGLALCAGVLGSYALFVSLTGRPPLFGQPDSVFWRIFMLSAVMAAVGLADDRWSLPPLVKLSGQLAVAFLAWLWAGVGFSDMWPAIPAWADCLLTVFWILGGVNAFNLIDGLDGLAAGIAMIASLGMAGALIFSSRSQSAFFYFAFAGGLLGFLRYNYNPASVFLGDCGSMFIGFIVSVLPLCLHSPNSFLVSVGVPLLAMGVPIFDTALAIMRRTLRRFEAGGTAAGAGHVMSADAEHLHHRILRAMGLSQRKTAWVLYGFSAFLVGVGIIGMYLQSRAAGLWLFAFTVALVVVFRDMAMVEFFDAGRILSDLAHSQSTALRRRYARLSVPFYVIFDMVALSAVFFAVRATLFKHDFSRHAVLVALTVRVTSVFLMLVFFNVYRTVWSRAMLSNYVRLVLACLLGSVAGSVVLYYVPSVSNRHFMAATLSYAMTSVFLLLFVRLARSIVRDMFYALDCARLAGRKDVSRVLVYGCGLRYRTFRRELVRTASANSRIIVGILDDDILLRGHQIGGIKVLGTLMEAPDIINRVNADAVVVACSVSGEWMNIVRKTLAPTGVKITLFSLTETPLEPGGAEDGAR